jgi:hypothetical protein
MNIFSSNTRYRRSKSRLLFISYTRPYLNFNRYAPSFTCVHDRSTVLEQTSTNNLDLVLKSKRLISKHNAGIHTKVECSFNKFLTSFRICTSTSMNCRLVCSLRRFVSRQLLATRIAASLRCKILVNNDNMLPRGFVCSGTSMPMTTSSSTSRYAHLVNRWRETIKSNRYHFVVVVVEFNYIHLPSDFQSSKHAPSIPTQCFSTLQQNCSSTDTNRPRWTKSFSTRNNRMAHETQRERDNHSEQKSGVVFLIGKDRQHRNFKLRR